MKDTLSIAYITLEGHITPGYWVDIIVRSENGESPPIKMKLDTGASISCIPKKYLEGKATLYGKPVIVSDFFNRKQRLLTYKVDILLLENGEPFSISRPFRGVVATEAETGYLGLDVLCDYEVLLTSDGGLMAPVNGVT